MHLPEQADEKGRYNKNRGSSGGHAWLKRATRRLFRRWRKKDPENAQDKYRYRGWEM